MKHVFRYHNLISFALQVTVDILWIVSLCQFLLFSLNGRNQSGLYEDESYRWMMLLNSEISIQLIQINAYIA